MGYFFRIEGLRFNTKISDNAKARTNSPKGVRRKIEDDKKRQAPIVDQNVVPKGSKDWGEVGLRETTRDGQREEHL